MYGSASRRPVLTTNAMIAASTRIASSLRAAGSAANWRRRPPGTGNRRRVFPPRDRASRIRATAPPSRECWLAPVAADCNAVLRGKQPTKRAQSIAHSDAAEPALPAVDSDGGKVCHCCIAASTLSRTSKPKATFAGALALPSGLPQRGARVQPVKPWQPRIRDPSAVLVASWVSGIGRRFSRIKSRKRASFTIRRCSGSSE